MNHLYAVALDLLAVSTLSTAKFASRLSPGSGERGAGFVA